VGAIYLNGSALAIPCFGRFNSLIADFVSLFGGFISLFGGVGNFPPVLLNFNDLPARSGSPDNAVRGFSLYFPSKREPRRDCLRRADEASFAII
jgi:hypothetical protein